MFLCDFPLSPPPAGHMVSLPESFNMALCTLPVSPGLSHTLTLSHSLSLSVSLIISHSLSACSPQAYVKQMVLEHGRIFISVEG